MPTAKQLDEILAVATTDEEVDHFFDQLTSPDWIPLLLSRGKFDSPPEPVQEGDGVWFPGWSRSRYLARVAGADPDTAAPVLLDISDTTNPRIWRDILAALATVPGPFAVPFLSNLRRWIHSPYQLGAEDEAAKIGTSFAAAGMVGEAQAVLASLAALAPPADRDLADLWEPLDEWDYERLVPALAAVLSEVSETTISVLADELQRAAISETAEDRIEHSSLWRPAVENHPQNWGHRRRLEKLVETIRDAAVLWAGRHPATLRTVVQGLLARPAGILKRIGIHVLVELGGHDLALVGDVLTTKEFFSNTEFHHEYYRLARAFFGRISGEHQLRYLELVDEVGHEKAEAGDPQNAVARADWWAWNRLGAVIDDLDGPPEDRYDALVAERGVEDHPDLLSWHQSWSGSRSPLSGVELDGLSLADLANYLGGWRDPERFGPAPSRDGLARQLQSVAANNPARYGPFADRLRTLPPIYAGWFLLGLKDAVKEGRAFDLKPAIRLCRTVITRSGVAEVDADGDRTWRSARIDVAWFIEELLIRNRLPDDNDGQVWATISDLLTDPEPQADSEGRFGDPLTHSINTVRGVAVNATVAYAWWSKGHAQNPQEWRLNTALPEVAVTLADHISPSRDPSVAIGAAIGWWLEVLISVDPGWVARHLGDLLGDLETPRQQAAWSAFLMRSHAGNATYQNLRTFYDRYAIQLAAISDEPIDQRGFDHSVVRFLAHIVVLEIHGQLDADSGPLDTILRGGSGWLLNDLVKEAGRLVHNEDPLESDLVEPFERLWSKLRVAIEDRESDETKQSLAAFSWWVASKLPATWTLPELVSLLDAGVKVAPEFLILPKLAEAVAQDEERTLAALERLAPQSSDEWAFRAHEKDVREILRVELASQDRGRHARARALVDRLGRLGMVDLGSLLS